MPRRLSIGFFVCALFWLPAAGTVWADAETDAEDFFSSDSETPPSTAEDFFGDEATPTTDSFRQTGRLSGKAWQKLACDTQKNNSDEFLGSSLSLIFADGSFILSPDLSVRLGAVVSYDLSWNEEERLGEYEPQLWEAFATYKIGSVDIAAGQKIWAWGLTDIVSPTNLINPIDLNRLFDVEVNLARLPTASVGATWYFSGLRLEGVYLPFFRASRSGSPAAARPGMGADSFACCSAR